jgi:hypothetical protein
MMFGTSGCKETPKVAGKKTIPIPCDTTIDVDPSQGVKEQAVYVCEGDTVAWDGHGATFVVQFKNESPFNSGGTVGSNSMTFDNKYLSGVAKRYDKLRVYEYKITVNGQAFDPQVVGGGNP